MATPQTFSQNDASHELNLDEARTVFAVIPDAYDTNERVVKMAMLVWNTVSLSWVKYTGSSGGGGASTIADGADTAEGATTDVAVVTDVNGTVSGKLRGLVKIFASAWDSVNGRLKVDGSAVTQPVSGTVTVNAGTNLNTSALALDSTVAKDASLAIIDADIKANQPRTVNVIAGFALEAGHLATIDANTPTLGQKTIASSSPVTIASDQGPVTVSATSLPLPAGAALETGNLLALTNDTHVTQTQYLQNILMELRLMNYQLKNGLNLPDDPDVLRSDPSFNTLQ